jgi:hypothetical protein
MSKPKQTPNGQTPPVHPVERFLLFNNELALQCWAEVSGAPRHGSPEQRAREVLETVEADEQLLEDTKPAQEHAKKLRTKIRIKKKKVKEAKGERRTELHKEIAAIKEQLEEAEAKCGERVFSDYEQKALTLDLVHACWPQGHSVPAELDLLLKKALLLPDTHNVGGWMLYLKDKAGHVEATPGGQKTNMAHWFAATEIESDYITDLCGRKAKELHPPKQLQPKLRARALAQLEREFRTREVDLEKKSELMPPDRMRALDELRSKYLANRDHLEGRGLPLTTAEFDEHVKPMSKNILAKEMERRFGSDAPKPSTLQDWRKKSEYRAAAYGREFRSRRMRSAGSTVTNGVTTANRRQCFNAVRPYALPSLP